MGNPGELDDLVRTTGAALRERAPLVHCLSTSVSAPFVAQALLAAGARPLMTVDPVDAPAMCATADVALVNLATATPLVREAIAACQESLANLPWVLDPAAIGVAPVRTRLARDLVRRRPALVRANASEVLVLAGQGRGGRGPDTTAASTDAEDAALALARLTGGAVAVSGAVDVIVSGAQVRRLARGHSLLARVSGTGCALGALAAACLGVCPHPIEAAWVASVWMSLAGERASRFATSPGSFAVRLIDALDEVAR